MRLAVSALTTLLLAGCVGYALVPPERTTIVGAYSVAPSVAWNKRTDTREERWTLDGNTLQEIIFINVGDDARILTAKLGGTSLRDNGVEQVPGVLPTYRNGMTLIEIKELIEASMAQLGALNLVTSNFRAAKFGSLDGFRFDLGFVRPEGLREKGFVVGAQAGERLHLIIFIAAATYYYERDLPEAERIVQSIAFPKA